MVAMYVDQEEEEVLFAYTNSTTSPPPSYYVQSPSTISNANSFEFQPCSNGVHNIHEAVTKTTNPSPEASRRFTISSRCSSTRESLTSNVSNSNSNSFVHVHANAVHEKKFPYNSLIEINGHHHHHHLELYEIKNGNIVVSEHDDDINIDDEKKDGHGGRGVCVYGDDEVQELEYYRGGWRKYLSFGTYDGLMWIGLQLSWRLIVSLAAALLVFYVATKPPPPRISVKVLGIREFELGEGVDSSGVSTKIMSCNTSVELLIENKSKVFGLHLHPPVLQMSFQHLTFAVSDDQLLGNKLIAERQHVTRLELYLGTRSKPMYGAGRMMQDMLDSAHGLPLEVTLNLISDYHVVGGFINPCFHHQARCLLLIAKAYDTKHRTHHFNTTCTVFAS